eukprot:m.96880 g.96880  ORF g.96880 m.96880 type:complete len:94 (-) comp18500_c0_seq1:22-303(-)
MQMAPDFASYKAEDNLFGELGPVCKGTIAPPNYDCTDGLWVGKTKFGAPHIVDLGDPLQARNHPFFQHKFQKKETRKDCFAQCQIEFFPWLLT